jgi:predicted lactoylglutathione lyase
MNTKIFVNLPVKNLARTREFFSALGYTFNPQFSNEQAACMVIGPDIYAMLLVEEFFQTFTNKPVADATRTTEVLLCLSCESRAQVDEMVAKAVASGGRAPNPRQDLGFMYSHGFEDPDGHVWELAWMAPEAVPPQA